MYYQYPWKFALQAAEIKEQVARDRQVFYGQKSWKDLDPRSNTEKPKTQ